MAVFRIEKTRDYTVMANHHLKNTDLSLKAKGLLSVILSLPESWNYTTRGLAAICKEGVDSIGGALRELEQAGYIIRNQLRDNKGRITDTEYTIYEQPQKSDTVEPYTENPYLDSPHMVEPCTDTTAQLNTYREKTNPENTHLENPYPIKSYPILDADAMGSDETEPYREIVKENIEYDILKDQFPYGHDRLDEVVELITETLCSNKRTLCIAGDSYSASVVKMKLLRLNSLHIQYVFECMDKNATDVRNIKKYLLAALFNAPSTIGNYYKSQFNHDQEYN